MLQFVSNLLCFFPAFARLEKHEVSLDIERA